MTYPKRKSLQAGFTLIELIMVIVLLAVVGTGILLYFTGLSAAPDRTVLTQAIFLADERLEQVVADAKSQGFNAITSEAAATLAAPFDRFTRGVEVFCVEEADLDAQSGTMPNCTDSDIRAKKATVTVSWAGGEVEAATVITRH